MKKIIIKPLIALAAALMLFTSCIDNEVDLIGYGDAYILVERSGQDTLFGLGLHAFSYSAFSAVNASLNEQSTPYVLQPFMGYSQDYVWVTPRAQYTKTLPVTGDYKFNVTFKEGRSQVLYDKLTADYIMPPVLTLCEFVPSTERIDVEWNLVPKADSYNIKLFSSTGDLLFVSQVYGNTANNYSFGKNSQGWQSSVLPTTGQSLTVEVNAYLLEPLTNLSDLQCIARTQKTVVWSK